MNALISANPEGLAHAATLLREGVVVAVPTETVYGLAADATNPQAVLAIYTTKGRPRFNPLIVHVADLESAQKLGDFSPAMLHLAAAFWPGPLTLVVPYIGGDLIPDVVRAGLPTIALRVPAHPVMQQLLATIQRPLAAPSANISGRVSATQAAHVLHDFAGKVPVLEGGICAVGLESTIIDGTTDTPTILRMGGLAREQIEAVLGQTLALATHEDNAPKAPGMLLKHYAPNAPVRLNATEVHAGEALLTFGATALQGATTLHLSPSGNLAEAALNLFAMLREADAATPTAIAVMPIPHEGLGEAINDRLQRATER
jgi:L-threonylcarbamoyladenylate synthase